MVPGGPPPPEVADRFRKIKGCCIVLIIAMVFKFLIGCALQGGANALLDSFNILFNVIIGIFLLRDDPTFTPAYNFMMTTCCQGCADQCQGGMSCLLTFVICNVINVVLDILLNGAVQRIVAGFEVMFNPANWMNNPIPTIILSTWVIALFSSYVAQSLGAWHAWQAYKTVRDFGVTATGGDWRRSNGDNMPSSGGGYAREMTPSAPPAQQSFQPFQGTGNRLGS
eukprot:gnl/TRDRNA2_/TRDRNA2_136535_c3_seq1.p1 gnl/TRDRNA2_/TRDRNA2_136535_c3~~gnl/TRDRNA2_/TRDRNA2_136535_c3_seq1.p1  ORF type:complete len:255 (-),score=43.19 gnl/TRDRNA2_/TRDRNA2_136535_c3_seq1:101-775(-)